MNCIKCSSARLGQIFAKCNDTFNLSIAGNSIEDSYVPYESGIGDEDYIDFIYCLDCGQIQKDFPLPTLEMEKEASDDQINDFYDNHFTENEKISYRKEHINYLIEAAFAESSSFGNFIKEFLENNRDDYLPSKEIFLKMFKENNSWIEV